MIGLISWIIHHIDVLILLIIMASLAYHLLAFWEGWKFRRHRAPASPPYLPPVTILKPLSHWDADTRDNVRTFCRQDYPRLQVVLGPKEGIAPLVANAPPCENDERTEVTTVVCREGMAVNPKISQVVQMWPYVRHDWILLVDQDMRVGPDYLRRILATLQKPGVGLVTCFHAVREVSTLPAFVEALLINATYLPSMLVGRRLMGGMRFALGATLATRRDIIEAIGGFEALADYLADDFHLGRLVRERGYRVVLSDYVVESRLPSMSWHQMVLHQLRWARTNRACAPRGWLFSVITHLLFWVMVFWVVDGFSVWGSRLLFASLLLRSAENTYYNYVFDGLRPAWKGAWLVPVQDAVYFLVWLLSFHTDTVEWAGHRYEIFPDGTMRPVTVEKVAHQPP